MRVPTDQGRKKDGLEDTVSSWGGGVGREPVSCCSSHRGAGPLGSVSAGAHCDHQVNRLGQVEMAPGEKARAIATESEGEGAGKGNATN